MTKDWESETYYVVKGGKPSGPFSLKELKDLQISPLDFVKTPDMPEFKELREIPSLSILLGQKPHVTAPQYFATLDVRLVAWGIDFFIAVFMYMIFVVAYLVGTEADDPQRIPTIIVGFLSVPVLKFLFSSILEGSDLQASPGKLLIGIKVCDSDGGKLSFAQAFWRNFSKLSGVLSLGVGFFMGFFDRKQRCLHDRIAGTLVIKSRLI